MKYPKLHDLSKRAAALVLTAALLVPSAFASRLHDAAEHLPHPGRRPDVHQHHIGAPLLRSDRELLLPAGAGQRHHPPSWSSPPAPSMAPPPSTRRSATRRAWATMWWAASTATFFTMSSGIPNGISIEDGVYKSSPEGNHAISVVDGRLELSASPQVELTLTNRRDGSSVSLTHFNKWRNSSGGLYLYNEDFSSVSTRTDSRMGWMVRFQVAEDDRDTPSPSTASSLWRSRRSSRPRTPSPSGRTTISSPPPMSPALPSCSPAIRWGQGHPVRLLLRPRHLRRPVGRGCGDIMIAKRKNDGQLHLALRHRTGPRTAVGGEGGRHHGVLRGGRLSSPATPPD